MRPWSRWLPVVALTVLGAALRFPTLDRQSFWLDELVTVSLLDRGLGDVLHEIPRTEATPYVYYAVAWVWGSLFGLGEVGLRSLSALAGTATVPVAYGAGLVLVSRRAGLVAAALVATNPFLVWYSQEARSYALLALLGAGSVLAFGLALRGGRTRARGLGGRLGARDRDALLRRLPRRGGGRLAARCVSGRGGPPSSHRSSRRPRSSPTCRSCSPSAATARPSPARPSSSRIAGIPKNLAVGYSFPAEALGSALAALLLVVGAALVVRLAPRERRGALVAGSLALAVIVTPVVLALAGADYVIARNAIAAVVPAAVCVGAGYAAGRLGLAAAAVLCVLSAAVALAPALDTAYGRTDWRGAAEPLETPGFARAIVVTPFMSRTLWRPYLPDLREPRAGGARVEEIAAVGLATEGGYSAGHVAPPTVSAPKAVKGFRVVAVERRPTYTLVLYRADRPDVRPDVDADRRRADGRATGGAPAAPVSPRLRTARAGVAASIPG